MLAHSQRRVTAHPNLRGSLRYARDGIDQCRDTEANQ